MILVFISYKWKETGPDKDHLNSTKKGSKENVLKLNYGSWFFVADVFCVVGGCQLWILGRTVVYGT